MSYQESIKPLDKKDYEIFYDKFKLWTLLAYLLGIIGGGIAFLNIQQKQSVVIFIVFEVLAIVLFVLAYFKFTNIIYNQKIVVEGLLTQKLIKLRKTQNIQGDLVEKEHYYFYFQKTANTRAVIKVNNEIYFMFGKGTNIKLHSINNKKSFYRYEKI